MKMASLFVRVAIERSIVRWLKHLTIASSDEKLSLVLDKFGPAGYGLYWLIIEQIAGQVDEKNSTSLTYSTRKWAKTCGTSSEKLRTFCDFSTKIGLFNAEKFLNGDLEMITINCRNVLKYRDEWTRKKAKKEKENSGEAPEETPEELPPKDTDTHIQTQTEKEKQNKKKVLRIFEFWQEKMEKPRSKFTPERQMKILARLKDGYSEEDCLKAVENCAKDPWHRGENPEGKEHVSINLIFRNGEKLEYFRDMVFKGPKGRGGLKGVPENLRKGN